VAVEEIVVTASKTGEAVREVSGSVTAITGETLAQIGAQSAQDFLDRAPGVGFNRQQPGFSTITIRGVNTSTSFANLFQGTTGSYINGVPLTDAYYSAGVPDIDAFDVRDVEVYRGPQGTLFGSSSLGGAVNYIANRPELDAVHAAGFASAAATRYGDGPSGAAKLMLNLPVAQGRAAVRAVAVLRHDAGYVDNLGTGDSAANETQAAGGRLMGRWQASDGLELNWLSLYQRTETDDAGWRNPDLDGLAKFTNVPEASRSTVEIHSLTADQALGFGTLTAQVAYHRKRAGFTSDLKRFGALGFQRPYLHDDVETEGYTAEVRLASPRGEALEWLIGAMIDDTDVTVLETAYASNSAQVADALLGTGGGAIATAGQAWGEAQNQFSGREAALFGEVAYSFTDALKVTLGGRLFRTKSDSDGRVEGLLAALTNGSLLSDPPSTPQKEEGFNPKASISWQATPDLRLYALASRGFRFGGANINPDPLLPRNFGSDSLWNYEAGLRSDWLDGTLRLDAAVFYIDWKDIPLTVSTRTGTVGVLNAGDAEIRGAEAEFSWRPAAGLSLSSNVTYLDTELTSVAAQAGLSFGVTPGSRLPATSRWRISSQIQYQWDAPSEPFVMLLHRYASSAPAVLQQYAPPGRNAKIGGYHLLDLRAGATYRGVEFAVFAENLTDERASISASYLAPPLANEILDYVARPRTVGVSMAWTY
jgi:outer membrane receptor protein involved in Fe transport